MSQAKLRIDTAEAGNMALHLEYQARARECLVLAHSTDDAQTKLWAFELAALLQRLAKKLGRPARRAPTLDIDGDGQVTEGS